MNELYECAHSYQRLLNVTYKIILGRKGKLTELFIIFDPSHFHHLIGLHKLVDLRISRANREAVFRDVLDEKITYNSVSQSNYFHIIHNRFSPFSNLEKLLDQNTLVFRYNRKSNPFSTIEADYLLSTPYKENDVYIFIAKSNCAGRYFCRSFFPKKERDYTESQPRYTMLYKEKHNLATGEIIVQYDRITPR